MRKHRILIGKPGLDGHDRGAKVIARMFRDGGYEVIYTGLHQTPEMIVNTSIQEDVDIIGLSIMSGAHRALVDAIAKLLAERDASDIILILGGIIPDQDFEFLKERGVKAIFTPGVSMKEILEEVAALL